MSKTALITGITGQDGAYLAEFLLKKGYIVHGIKRRASLFNTDRIDHLYQDPHIDNRNFILHYGDLTDSTNLIRIVQETQPDEIYNLGAQSHVQVSFETPEYTANGDGLGVLRLLEAIRILKLEGKTKFYQASTSELYGLVQEVPQSEKTPFYPRSPYAAAKLYGYWITVNYREAYGMFASNGILFNHETMAGNMPVIFKIGKNGPIDIKPLSQVVKEYTNPGSIAIDETRGVYQETAVSSELYVWDNTDWTKVLYASAYPHDIRQDNKQPRWIVAKNAAYMATGSHMCIMEDGSEKSFGDMTLEDKVNLITYPSPVTATLDIGEAEAELLGFIVGDGSVKEGRQLQLTGKDLSELKYYESIWCNLHPDNEVHYWQTQSAFSEGMIWQMRLNHAGAFVQKYAFYDEYHRKQVPHQILNADEAIQLAFLKGYNAADGMKANPCVYEFKNFKTNSTTLAAGLLFLLNKVTGQEYNINIEQSDKWGKEAFYFSINLLSNSAAGQNHRTLTDKKEKVLELMEQEVSQRGMERETGISRNFIRKVQHGYDPSPDHHFSKPNNQVKKIIEMPHYDGWFYDITTESSTFHCGIGQGHVHNSPLRGETFVTRKITRAAARIALGIDNCLYLGNLDAQRDWGHAKDYIEGMYLILQHDQPDDFVLATGRTTYIRDFVRMAFQEVGVELEFSGTGEAEKAVVASTANPDYHFTIGQTVVAVDSRYFRPTEVDLLIGDATKARTLLGWEPKYMLEEMVKEMVASDLKKEKQ